MIDPNDLTTTPEGKLLYKGIDMNFSTSIIQDLKAQGYSYDIVQLESMILREYNKHLSVIRDKKIDDILRQI